MSGPGDDSMLDEYLKRDSDVSRRYRELDADGVPPELDRRVLDQARAAVEKPRRWMRWSAPIALAASAVLVVSIVIETGVDKEAVLNDVSPPQRQDTAAAKSAQAPAAEVPAASIESDESVEVRGYAVPAQEREEARASRAPVIPGEAHTPVMVVPVRPASPPAAAAPDAAAPEAAAADAAAPAATATPPAPSYERRSREGAVGLTSRRLPAPSTDATDRDSSESVAQNEKATESADAAKREALARDQASAAAIEEVQGVRQPVNVPNPEAWLESIRQLRRDGKAAQAEREWSRFRKVFPDYAVAADDPAQPATTRR